MDLTHVHAFTEAMAHKDLETMLTHMSDDIVLNTPFTAEPALGKDAVRNIVVGLFGVVDTFEFLEFMQGSAHVSSFFKLTSGTTTVEAMDFWLLDAAGRIKEMSVFWRPLSAGLEIQKKLAAPAP
jgi:hypothetical protein